MITKRKFVILSAVTVLAMTMAASQAQQYYWSNFAGAPGGIGSGTGTGNAVQLNAPFATAVDSGGNIYVADSNNNVIRMLTLSGTTWTVSTIAGNPGVSGTTDGTGSAALFNVPTGVAVDSGSNIYVADSGNYTIRKLTFSGSNWTSTTIAGSPGQSGYADATGNSIMFGCPESVAIDSSGNLYVADATNNIIRELMHSGSNYSSMTLAGIPGNAGYADGAAATAQFDSPLGVTVDSGGNVYVADTFNHLIRKISTGGAVSTVAGTPVLYGLENGSGTAAMFNYPSGITVDSGGNLYVADSSNHLIRKITSAGVVTTLAGTTLNATSLTGGVSGSPGFKNGLGGAAAFNFPHGVALDSTGNLYVADTSNDAIRKVSPGGDVFTIAGSPIQAGSTSGTGAVANFNAPCGITVSSGTAVYVVDTSNLTVRQVTYGAVVSTISGDLGVAGTTDSTGLLTKYNFPFGAAADNSGHVYIADSSNNTIRQLTITGASVVTIAGTPGLLGFANGSGTNAQFDYPIGVAVDSTGHVYVADTYNSVIRKLTVSGTTWTAATFSGSAGVTGTNDGAAPLFAYPAGVAVDAGGNVYVADSGNYTIRMLNTSGSSTTIAGTPGVPGSSDGIGNGAQFGYPTAIAVDSGTNLYVVDSANSTIRKMTNTGTGWAVVTIGGTPGALGSANGPGTSGFFSNPYAIAVDPKGNLFVADSGNNRVAIGSYAGSGTVGTLTGTSVTLLGMANPNGAGTGTVYYMYGTSTTYGSFSGTQTVSGTGLVAISGTLNGLTANTTYHYELVDITSSGTYFGTDQTFTTLPTAIPSITSAATATGTAGLAFSYTIVASNSPTGFGATPLPSGLTVDSPSGAIFGTPSASGTTTVTLSATNAIGTGTKGLTLSIVPLQLPVISSGSTASGVLGSNFNYNIVANNATTSYFASGLPSGLSVNPSTGLISGAPSASGTFAATMSAVNLTGTTTAPLNITITPVYTWSNLAGTPAASGTVDGRVNVALFSYPGATAVDASGNIYIADSSNYVIRKLSLSGSTWIASTLAGSGHYGAADGVGTAAQFAYPQGLAMGVDGNIYVMDTDNSAIRRVTPAGVVTTIAGTLGVSGTLDGVGSAARFYYASGIASDTNGNFYVADTDALTIRKVTPSGTTWTVTTIAGSPQVSGSADGTGSAARFYYPEGIATDPNGNVYVADSDNETIRELVPSGTTWAVTTISGSAQQSGTNNGAASAARYDFPAGIVLVGSGTLMVMDQYNSTVRQLTLSGTTWTASTFAGSPQTTGASDGTGSAARFYYPKGISADAGGNCYIADSQNDTIRKMTLAGVVTTLAGSPGVSGFTNGVAGKPAQMSGPNSIVADGSGNIYVADTLNNTIREITLSGSVVTIAGVASGTGSADGTGSAALFNNPAGIAMDQSGNLYVADTGNDTIRKLAFSGSNWSSVTFAGTPGTTGTTSGTQTLFNGPKGVALDGTGNIYVADSGNNAIRKYVKSSGTWTNLAGVVGPTGTGSTNGTGAGAKFNNPTALALDAAGNVYVADYNNNAIRLVTQAGVVTTLAGVIGTTGTGNADGIGTAARFTNPNGIAVDSGTNIYVGDYANYSVRKITPSGATWMVMTIAGIGYSTTTSGTGTAAGFEGPSGIAVDTYGNVYVADSTGDRVSIGASLLFPAITSSLTVTGTQGSPFSYTITASSMNDLYSTYAASGLPAGLSVNANTGFITGTATATGTYAPIISAVNLAGTGSGALTLIISGSGSQVNFANWQNTNFTPSQLSNPAISGDSATPAGDGITNLMKYALNLNPFTNGTQGLPVTGVLTLGGTNYLTLSYTQVIGASDLTYTPQATGDLQNWGTGPIQVISTSTNGTTVTVTVQDMVPMSGTARQFMRLQVKGP